MTANDAIARAVAAAGLDAFGPGDWREGLERTVAAFAAMPLNAAGRKKAEAMIVGDLVRRLRIEDWYRSHPGIDGMAVERPLLVCGLPRTGTTATVAMFAVDRQFRFLRKWEAASPVPPPVAHTEEHDPRRVAAHEKAKAYTLGALHLNDPDGPEEDLLALAGLTMRSFLGSYPTPDEYIRWWIEDDFQSTYAYHERVLKLLHCERGPRRWLLKSPPHLFKLEAFAARYPDAQFVWTHRDPAKVIPSVASLHHNVFALSGVEPMVSKRWTGKRSLDFWAEGMRRGLEARARIGEHRFIDVYNSDVVRDPIGTFETTYARLRLTITADVKAALERYHAHHARGAHGTHDYTLEEYGLTRDEVREAFKDYIDRFGV